MKCTECCYYWQDEDENRPRCHWEDPRFPAPCEYDTMETADDPEDWEEPDTWDDETGFDPYEGCYTWDC
jgi:hypothetical protein